jgi:tetratricopeptide (TPR) repeat protein
VEETKAYFDAVAEAAREHGDDETAERIEVLDADIREGVYQALCHCDETADERGVRPILLSLVIDHLVTSGRPSEALRESIQQPNAEHAAQTRRRIEAGLVEALMNVPRSAIETIRTLAVLRKGADASLLARAAGLQASDGMWEETKARDRLDEIRSLSFVKIRPRDQRVFLHDEMYDLLRRHVMDKPGGESQKRRVLRDADDYYDEAIEEARNRLAKLVPDPGEAFPKLEVLSDLRVKLEDLLTEALHYALRRDPQKGVDTYIRLAAGTLAANDESLDMRLRAELFGTLGQERTYAVHEREWASDDFTRGRWNERLEDLDKLLAEVVIPDAAVRWVKRLTQRRQYAAALEVAARLRSDAVDLIRPGGGLALADLAAWEGALRAYQGDYEEAEKAMREAQREVEGAASLGDVRWRAVMGRIYNNLGYIARTSGQVLRAAELYKDALPYWRDLKLEILQANTLNNLAYALALQGGFGDARRQAKDALDLRKRLGPQPPVVLSLTTLAEIEILAGRYQDAEAYAEHARQLAENLDYERGKGLALLALAALRRFLADPQETSSTEERRQLLVGALQASQQALDIFRELGEWEGRFRGFYEKAIALREQCRLAHEDGDSHWSQTQLEQKARTADSAFERAAKESREHGRWDLYFDAQMGRAWLNQYLEAEDAEAYLDTVLNDVRELVPEYLIKPTRWPGIADTTIIGVFAQLARYHILHGILVLDRAEEAVTDEKANYLSEAGVQFTLAFEYDRHIAEDFRDLNRGIEVVYDRLRGFNTGELLAVFDGANLAWGRHMPRRGGPGHIQRAEDLLFWRTLEEHFGTYEKLRDLARAEN